METELTSNDYRKFYLYARQQGLSLLQMGILLALKKKEMNMVELSTDTAANDSSVRNALKVLMHMEIVDRKEFNYYLNLTLK